MARSAPGPSCLDLSKLDGSWVTLVATLSSPHSLSLSISLSLCLYPLTVIGDLRIFCLLVFVLSFFLPFFLVFLVLSFLSLSSFINFLLFSFHFRILSAFIFLLSFATEVCLFDGNRFQTKHAIICICTEGERFPESAWNVCLLGNFRGKPCLP